MEFVNLMLHVIVIIGIMRLGLALSEMRETFKMVMYENDIPDDLRRYLDGQGKGW